MAVESRDEINWEIMGEVYKMQDAGIVIDDPTLLKMLAGKRTTLEEEVEACEMFTELKRFKSKLAGVS